MATGRPASPPGPCRAVTVDTDSRPPIGSCSTRTSSPAGRPGCTTPTAGPAGGRSSSKEGLVSVELQPGDRKVEFYYLPDSFLWGAWISALTAVGCLGALLFREGRRLEPPALTALRRLVAAHWSARPRSCLPPWSWDSTCRSSSVIRHGRWSTCPPSGPSRWRWCSWSCQAGRWWPRWSAAAGWPR